MLTSFNRQINLIFEQILNYITTEVSNHEMGEIIASHSIKNNNPNMNNDFANLKKLLYDDETVWVLLKDAQQNILACAGTKNNNGCLFINELFSFKKGAGSILLLIILNKDVKMVYLNSDWSQPQTLNDYYRQIKFGLTEYVVHRDHYDVHYFYKNKKLSNKQLTEFIKNNFY